MFDRHCAKNYPITHCTQSAVFCGICWRISYWKNSFFVQWESWILFLNCRYCVKSIQIRSISNPYFPVFGLNTDQKNSVFGQFLRSTYNRKLPSLRIKFLNFKKSYNYKFQDTSLRHIYSIYSELHEVQTLTTKRLKTLVSM